MVSTLAAAARCRCLAVPPSALLLIPRRGTRRTGTRPPWVPEKFDQDLYYERLSPDNQQLLEEVFQQNKTVNCTSPLIEAPHQAVDFVPGARRVGLIGRKIGVMPQWTNKGVRMLCTLFHIEDCEVVSTVDPETWYRTSIIGKRKACGFRLGPMWKVTVGAINANPHQYTESYRRIFERAGVPTKEMLASFLVSESAILRPGTKLYAEHFEVGQYVTVSGHSIDWGFQGVMHRWGMRGQPGSADCTKSHRRVGSIGSKGDARVWPGRRLPGHMGYEWRHTSGLQPLGEVVFQIHLSEIEVLYVRGCTPGDTNQLLLIKDCIAEKWEKKQVKGGFFELEDITCDNGIAIPDKLPAELPFPTYFPTDEETKPAEGDLYADFMHRMSDPTITFAAEDAKVAPRDKTKAKTSKAKK